MKIGIVLQVFTVVYQYRIVTGIYGFGAKKPYYFGPQPYVHKPSLSPLGIYGKPAFTLEDLRIKSEYEQPHADQNLLDGYFGAQSYIHHNAQAHALPQQAVIHAMEKHPISYGKLLKPILLLPNGWIQGVNFGGSSDIKPVTEEQPDDLKYDFRTQAHFLR